MKKIIALLIAMLLPICASAETIAQQINAPFTYQAEYQSNTGRTKITVDAAVYVPEVDVIPTYAVSVRDFTVEEGQRLTQLLHPDLEWRRWSQERDLSYDEMYHSYSGSNDQYESSTWRVSLPEPYDAYVHLMNSYVLGIFNRQPDERQLRYRWTDPDTNLFFFYSADFSESNTIGKSLKGQSLNVDEAMAMANAFMAEMAPDYELRTVFGVEGEKGDAKVYHTLAYCFAYTRAVNDIPITYVNYGNVHTDFVDTAMAPAPGQELITVVIHEDRIVNFYWQDPYEIGGIIQAETKLLPFEEIMGIFGTIAPLSIQSTENDTGAKSKANNGMHITEIRLGYMPVLCKDNPNQWELRPVWDFMGSRILPLATYDYPSYSLLTIDAIDGTIIDRNYGY